MGTLVLDEATWNRWWQGTDLLPGYATVEEAAERIVQANDNVYYGCPYCLFRSKDAQASQEHITTHVNRLLGQLQIEVNHDQTT
jgi:hypothetical protein